MTVLMVVCATVCLASAGVSYYALYQLRGIVNRWIELAAKDAQ